MVESFALGTRRSLGETRDTVTRMASVDSSDVEDEQWCADAITSTPMVVVIELPEFDFRTDMCLDVKSGCHHRVTNGVIELVRSFTLKHKSDLATDLGDSFLERLESVRKKVLKNFQEWSRKDQLVDEWKKQNERAQSQLHSMRDAYFREINHMREQLYRQGQTVSATANPQGQQADCAIHYDIVEYLTEDEKSRVVKDIAQKEKKQLEDEYAAYKADTQLRLRALREGLIATKMLQHQRTQLLDKVVEKYGFQDEEDMQDCLGCGLSLSDIQEVAAQLEQEVALLETEALQWQRCQELAAIRADTTEDGCIGDLQRRSESPRWGKSQYNDTPEADVFLSFLDKKFGSVKKAARELCSTWPFKEPLSLQDFGRLVRELGYVCNPQAAYKALCADTGALVLGELLGANRRNSVHIEAVQAARKSGDNSGPRTTTDDEDGASSSSEDSDGGSPEESGKEDEEKNEPIPRRGRGPAKTGQSFNALKLVSNIMKWKKTRSNRQVPTLGGGMPVDRVDAATMTDQELGTQALAVPACDVPSSGEGAHIGIEAAPGRRPETEEKGTETMVVATMEQGTNTEDPLHLTLDAKKIDSMRFSDGERSSSTSDEDESVWPSACYRSEPARGSRYVPSATDSQIPEWESERVTAKHRGFWMASDSTTSSDQLLPLIDDGCRPLSPANTFGSQAATGGGLPPLSAAHDVDQDAKWASNSLRSTELRSTEIRSTEASTLRPTTQSCSTQLGDWDLVMECNPGPERRVHTVSPLRGSKSQVPGGQELAPPSARFRRGLSGGECPSRRLLAQVGDESQLNQEWMSSCDQKLPDVSGDSFNCGRSSNPLEAGASVSLTVPRSTSSSRRGSGANCSRRGSSVAAPGPAPRSSRTFVDFTGMPASPPPVAKNGPSSLQTARRRVSGAGGFRHSHGAGRQSVVMALTSSGSGAETDGSSEPPVTHASPSVQTLLEKHGVTSSGPAGAKTVHAAPSIMAEVDLAPRASSGGQSLLDKYCPANPGTAKLPPAVNTSTPRTTPRYSLAR